MNQEAFLDFVSKCIAVDKINAVCELRDELKHYLPEDEDNIDKAFDILTDVISNQTKLASVTLEEFK